MTSPTDASQQTERDDGEGRVWMKVYFSAEERRSALARAIDDMRAMESIRQIPFHQRLNRKPWER